MSSWTHERARIAALTRAIRAGERPVDDPALPEARRNLKAARAADYIRKVLEEAPPLSDEQRTQLAELLKPVRRGP